MTCTNKTWSLYVVRTSDGCLYTGISTDVKRRIAEHVAGGDKAARFLRARKVDGVVFRRRIGSRSLALKVEYRFKRLSKAAKERIVSTRRLRFDTETGMIRIPASITRMKRKR